jgi:hypothetical protein
MLDVHITYTYIVVSFIRMGIQDSRHPAAAGQSMRLLSISIHLNEEEIDEWTSRRR